MSLTISQDILVSAASVFIKSVYCESSNFIEVQQLRVEFPFKCGDGHERILDPFLISSLITYSQQQSHVPLKAYATKDQQLSVTPGQ